MTFEKVKARFAELVPSINHAAQVCEAEGSVPRELAESIADLARGFEQGRKWIGKSMDEQAVHRWIDDLEEKSDVVLRACETSGGISRELKTAVFVAHNQISELKHQIH
jgi:hypothetical protein